jgi:hypothetical protein
LPFKCNLQRYSEVMQSTGRAIAYFSTVEPPPLTAGLWKLNALDPELESALLQPLRL